LLPTVSTTVTRRPKRRAISTVLSVQLSATTMIRSGRRVWASSAWIVRPIESCSLWAGTTTTVFAVFVLRGRCCRRCSASDAAW
jgi:hypothetical protein